MGIGNALKEHILRRIVRVIDGAIGKGLTPAAAGPGLQGMVIVILVLDMAGEHLPHVDKPGGETPGTRAVQQHAAVLPLSKTADKIGILIRHIHPAGIGILPVNAQDLPVIPIIEVQAVDILVDRVEDFRLHPGLPHPLNSLPTHPGDISEIVKNDLDLHPMAGPLRQDLHKPIPELALRQDEVFQENKALRPGHPAQGIGKKSISAGKVGHIRLTVEQKIPLGQHGSGPPPVGQHLSQPLQVSLALALFRTPVGRSLYRQQIQPFALDIAAPENIQDQPRHRYRYHQQRPGQLVAAAGGAALDIDGHKDGGRLHNDGQHKGGMGLKKIGQQHYRRHIHYQQHQHQSQTQRGGNPPLCGLLDGTLHNGMFHSLLLSQG